MFLKTCFDKGIAPPMWAKSIITPIPKDKVNKVNAFTIYTDNTAELESSNANIDARGDKAIPTVSWVKLNTTDTIDNQLKNADVTNMEYDINGNLTQVTYGAINNLNAGYTGRYTYDIYGVLQTIIYWSDIPQLVLTVTYSYNSGNLISMIRS